MRRLVSAFALILAGTPALAEGWTIQTLGTMPSTEDCMDHARIVLNQYIYDHGNAETASDSWSVYAFDLMPGTVDAVIMCATGGGDYVNATLVLHSEEDERTGLANEIYDIWTK